ncbi:MAG: SseB family protein [Nocardioidaceae bacterium]
MPDPEHPPPRSIPDPGFAGDDGGADPAVTQALSSYAADPDRRHAATLEVLQRARLLVPVVAVLGEVEYDEHGLAHDKTSDMAAVLMQGRDGRTALLAFTGTEALRRWNPEARPVPVPASQAAKAALQDGAAALLVDVAGPTMFVVESDDLQSLAAGHTLVELAGEAGGAVSGRYAWVTPGR